MRPFSDIEERLDRVFRLVEATAGSGEEELCTVETMAREACYSLFHFIRLFPRYTLYTPYEYLIRRRLSLALEGMFSRGQSVTEAAWTASLQSDAFSRAVRRCCGASPRSLDPQDLQFLPTPWTPHRLRAYQLLLAGDRPRPARSRPLPGAESPPRGGLSPESDLFREEALLLTREYLGQTGHSREGKVSAEDLLRRWCEEPEGTTRERSSRTVQTRLGEQLPLQKTARKEEAYFCYLQRSLTFPATSTHAEARGFSPGP
ncbi:helix-turn-helix domain-containing protein [Alkalispirochaeta alkalica]|uniref:helix-turn-helix domain-containing protein n=1 Tax=Alkalispirochaeta alkalica TaxID=46356 RepID=UPI00037E5818|nr:helix-turn-helix domain-containing protein [Alkalispirochaeta alkalica]